MAKRINPLAPYFVQMRELERRLLNSALDQAAEMVGPTAQFSKRVAMAAGFLGVHTTYIRVRARVLGGVLPNDPKREPPEASPSKIWKEENGAGKTRSPAAKPRPPKLEIVKPPKEPEPDAQPDPADAPAEQ